MTTSKTHLSRTWGCQCDHRTFFSSVMVAFSFSFSVTAFRSSQIVSSGSCHERPCLVHRYDSWQPNVLTRGQAAKLLPLPHSPSNFLIFSAEAVIADNHERGTFFRRLSPRPWAVISLPTFSHPVHRSPFVSGQDKMCSSTRFSLFERALSSSFWFLL